VEGNDESMEQWRTGLNTDVDMNARSSLARELTASFVKKSVPIVRYGVTELICISMSFGIRR